MCLLSCLSCFNLGWRLESVEAKNHSGLYCMRETTVFTPRWQKDYSGTLISIPHSKWLFIINYNLIPDLLTSCLLSILKQPNSHHSFDEWDFIFFILRWLDLSRNLIKYLAASHILSPDY